MRKYSKELHRSEQDFINSLRRLGEGFDFEPIDSYVGRVGPLLPNLPPDVLEQWVYRHHSDLDDYAWLSLRDLRCQLETWAVEDIRERIDTGWSDELINKHRVRLLEDPEVQASWLGQRMLAEGTWPVDPIVIENAIGLTRPDGLLLGTPYHFVEGHHRMGYFRALADRAILAPHHDVWVVAPAPDAVMEFWPMNDLDIEF